MSKVTDGLSVRRDHSYHMNVSTENLTIALLSYRAGSRVGVGGVRSLLVPYVIRSHGAGYVQIRHTNSESRLRKPELETEYDLTKRQNQ